MKMTVDLTQSGLWLLCVPDGVQDRQLIEDLAKHWPGPKPDFQEFTGAVGFNLVNVAAQTPLGFIPDTSEKAPPLSDPGPVQPIQGQPGQSQEPPAGGMEH